MVFAGPCSGIPGSAERFSFDRKTREQPGTSSGSACPVLRFAGHMCRETVISQAPSWYTLPYVDDYPIMTFPATPLFSPTVSVYPCTLISLRPLDSARVFSRVSPFIVTSFFIHLARLKAQAGGPVTRGIFVPRVCMDFATAVDFTTGWITETSDVCIFHNVVFMLDGGWLTREVSRPIE